MDFYFFEYFGTLGFSSLTPVNIKISANIALSSFVSKFSIFTFHLVKGLPGESGETFLTSVLNFIN